MWVCSRAGMSVNREEVTVAVASIVIGTVSGTVTGTVAAVLINFKMRPTNFGNSSSDEL